ncbi:GNAT family N-acetyltransferase [Sphingobacterium sp. lm-10]|uniref:GNAT family N-acetyltransferase n=1 Tax=Sphingobacterium sp. lm-10 TaxID=2944904 RepID=UPI002021F04E|nr:GNAT family N-acetyltransferase [Sphingobacterium sp. lm-10]MCL7987656.1 GNAT family N-acetyltransferase [Sphingobacterium sp. lm-10]
MSNYLFRQAKIREANAIWNILQDAVARRKADGSAQWQDGYPNLQVVEKDIDRGAGYVLVDGDFLVGYCAILIDDEPAYQNIQGTWLTDGSFVVFHRVAVSKDYIGMGMAQQLLLHIETFAKEHAIQSLRADTNFDNTAMLRIFEKMNYQYCGEVVFRGSSRKAFEKVLAV